MPTGDDSIFQIIACIVISILCAYGGGRIHQWYKHGMDHDRSFRDGFSHGYHALFPLAARRTGPAADRAAPGGRDDRPRQAAESLPDRPVVDLLATDAVASIRAAAAIPATIPGPASIAPIG